MSPTTLIHKIDQIIKDNCPTFKKWQLDNLREDQTASDDVTIVDRIEKVAFRN